MAKSVMVHNVKNIFTESDPKPSQSRSQESETLLKYKIRPIRDTLQDVYKLQISFINFIKYTQKYYDISIGDILKSVFSEQYNNK